MERILCKDKAQSLVQNTFNAPANSPSVKRLSLETSDSPLKKSKQLHDSHENPVQELPEEPPVDEVISSGNIPGVLQMIQLTQGHNLDEMVSEILDLFPELNEEMKNPKDSLKEILESIYKIQSAGSYASKVHWPKNDQIVYTVDVVSDKLAYIEIKRSDADKAKHGGESKFGRIIGIMDGKIQRLVGMKIRFNENDRDAEIKIRLDKSTQFKALELSSKHTVAIPQEQIQFINKKNQKQLLAIFEDMGDHIFSTATKENWDLKTTIDAMAQAAVSLQHLHSKGLLHRDLKPQNILGKTDPKNGLMVKIADLSFLIKESDSPSSSFAGTPDFIGKQYYLNLKNGKPESNSKETDRYAFGLTLLKMVERTDGFPNISEQGEYFLENSKNIPFIQTLKSKKSVLNKIERDQLIITEIGKLVGVLTQLKTNPSNTQIIRDINKAFQANFTNAQQAIEAVTHGLLTFLIALEKSLSTSGKAAASRLTKLKGIDSLASSGNVAPEFIALLQELNRDFTIEYYHERNNYLGLMLPEMERIVEFKKLPLFGIFQLIYDLMQDGKIKDTEEVLKRFEMIQNSFDQ